MNTESTNNPVTPAFEQAKNVIAEQARAVSGAVSEQAKAVAGTAAQAWESTKGKASDALYTSEQYVRENPGTSVLSVFGAGIALGVLIGWTVAHESRTSYSDSAHDILRRLGRKLNLD